MRNLLKSVHALWPNAELFPYSASDMNQTETDLTAIPFAYRLILLMYLLYSPM